MKTAVMRSPFFAALRSVLSVVATKTSLPVLAMVRIEAKGDTLSVSATDLDAGLTLEVEAATDEDGVILAPAKLLKKVVGAFPKCAHICLSSLDDLGGVSVASGKAEYALYGVPSEEFPMATVVEGFAFDCLSMADVVNRVAYAASTEESRPLLNSVLFDIGRDGVYAVATNGHRLARLRICGPCDSESFVVPAKALKAVAKWKYTRVASGSLHSCFRTEGASFTVRNIEGPYPNYLQVFPTACDKTLLVDRNLLLEAVTRLSVLASDHTGRLRLSCDQGSFVVSVDSPDKGKATEELDAAYEGEPIAIGLDSRYVIEILKRFKGDIVRIKMQEPERAVLWESDGDPDYTCLLMPLRLI